jgi:hypothetical protein
MSDDRARPSSWLAGRRLIVALACAALLVAAGALLGERSSKGTKHAQVVQGVAMRANSHNDLVTFEGEDGIQLQVGLMRVASPDGGSFEQAVWVECS